MLDFLKHLVVQCYYSRVWKSCNETNWTFIQLEQCNHGKCVHSLQVQLNVQIVYLFVLLIISNIPPLLISLHL